MKNIVFLLSMSLFGCAWTQPTLNNPVAVETKKNSRLPSSYDACAEASDTQGGDSIFSICSGDRASVNQRTGTVIGVNPRKKQVTIRFESGSVETVGIEYVTVNKGCYLKYCADDSGAVMQRAGVIIGVNPVTKMISLRYNSGVIETVSAQHVSVGKGCLRGYCVGERAAINTRVGRIIGVNPIKYYISVMLDSGVIESVSQEYVAVGKGCLSGYCVGDRGAVGSRAGKIVGVNPLKNEIALTFDSGVSESVHIDNVSVNSLCYQYSANDYRRDVETLEQFTETFTTDDRQEAELERARKEAAKKPVEVKKEPAYIPAGPEKNPGYLPMGPGAKDPNAQFCHLRSTQQKCEELNGICQWIPPTSSYCQARPGSTDPNAIFCSHRSSQQKCQELSGVCEWTGQASGYCQAR
ncbi:hypothetical protein DOM21_05505 [Bacteriovorax stolpii]|uniref:hypothetical protein n=1 Tax=Bacteriovorax stolpii TaxID=960 RepID=UPI0011589D3E|nr:hypothetical protein [Bacteriovorax stolpii]QDK40921.1 hypothetical protein DOM21_05505 [Bacteriovorax stolpii]